MSAPTLMSLQRRIEALEKAVAELKGARAELAAELDLGELKRQILAVARDLNATKGMGGLVPIPAIKDELTARRVKAKNAEVDRALVELEDEFTIDLSIAQSPTTAKRAELGIDRGARGLAMYVVIR